MRIDFGRLALILVLSFVFLPTVFALSGSDLAITSVDIFPENPQFDENAIISIRIANLGTEVSQNIGLFSHRDWEDEFSHPQSNTWPTEAPLNPGESRDYSYTVIFDHNGNWAVWSNIVEQAPNSDLNISNNSIFKYLNIGPVVTDPAIFDLIAAPYPDQNTHFFVGLKVLNNSTQWYSPGNYTLTAKDMDSNSIYDFSANKFFGDEPPSQIQGYQNAIEVPHEGTWEITVSLRPWNADANLANNTKTIIARTDSNQAHYYFIDLQFRIQIPNETFVAGQRYPIPIEITNLGNFDYSGSFDINTNYFAEGTPFFNAILYGWRVNEGQTIVKTINFTPTKEGVWTIQAQGKEYYGWDSNSGNNFDAVQVQVESQLPNIHFTEPLKVVDGALEFHYTLDGNQIYMCGVEVTGTQEDPNAGFEFGHTCEPGMVYDQRVPLNFNDNNRLITVALDPHNVIEESNENDNNAFIYASNSLKPNLIIERIFVLPARPTTSSASAPNPGYVFVSVRNIGEDVAGPSILRLDVNFGAIMPPSTQFLPTIPLWPNEHTIITVQYKYLPRNQLVIATADFFNDVNESNENDNVGHYP